MKRLLTIIAALLLISFTSPLFGQVHDLDITVTLNQNGSAHIQEIWNLNAFEGTEWYLVRSNLGDIKVSNLRVSENGRQFENEGSWDVDRSLNRKAGKCGIVSKSNGVEICWGLGSMGEHVFTVDYDMSNVVKSLDDYDMVHMQFVNPGLSSPPEHVRVTLCSSGISFNDENSRIWGFGYYGNANYVNGNMVFESSESFGRNSSVISLVRIDKGMFNSSSVQEKSFDDVLNRAMEGSSWENSNDDDFTKEDALSIFGTLFVFLAGMFGVAKYGMKKRYQNILGVNSIKEISWARDVPFNGDIVLSEAVLKKLYASNQKNYIASAIILRLIQQDYLRVNKDEKGNVEISFTDKQPALNYETVEGQLYNMMREASGSDLILQNKEFSRWSKKHTKTIYKWTEKVTTQGESRLISGNWSKGSKFTADGQKNARDLIGLKNFLKDFTLSSERGSEEVGLWQDYLVFASLFGVAEKVAKELRDINPQAFDEVMPYDYQTMRNVLTTTNNLSTSITNAQTSYASRSGAAGGHGGSSSFGGGGGFSGGGFGGGAR